MPVRYPDPQRLSELPGYEQEREKVIANTRALLEGRPANNVLLYGDAGTGKSSTVKAIANEFAPDGLRLIEVKKNQLYQIPALMDELAKNPLKFILFIDDLSFASNDDNFAALKAILEGGVGGRSHNVAVYATSNRRHLVKETMADRSGDDLHAMDARQELHESVGPVRPDGDVPAARQGPLRPHFAGTGEAVRERPDAQRPDCSSRARPSLCVPAAAVPAWQNSLWNCWRRGWRSDLDSEEIRERKRVWQEKISFLFSFSFDLVYVYALSVTSLNPASVSFSLIVSICAASRVSSPSFRKQTGDGHVRVTAVVVDADDVCAAGRQCR